MAGSVTQLALLVRGPAFGSSNSRIISCTRFSVFIESTLKYAILSEWTFLEPCNQELMEFWNEGIKNAQWTSLKLIKKIHFSVNWKRLTEAGAYPQLPTQPKLFWSFSNLYSNLLWSFSVVSRRKIEIWIRGKKVQFITKKGSLQTFLPWKWNFL